MNRSVPSDDLAVGIDIGGSKTAIGVVDRRDGRVLERRIVATPTRENSGPSFLAELARHAAELRLGNGSDATVNRVGIGVCELVDSSGEIVSAHRVDFNRHQVNEAFRNFGMVSVDSDVRAAAIAEARFGHGRGLKHWIYVNAGTGISSVLMNGERCHVGEHGWVYSLGMSPADLGASEPAAGWLIEEISGGAGLLAAAHGKGLKVTSVRELLDEAGPMSGIAADVLSKGGQVLGSAIALLVNTLDPAAIIVGGGIVSSDSPYWHALVAAVHAQVWHPPAKRIVVRHAALSADAGMIGAAVNTALVND